MEYNSWTEVKANNSYKKKYILGLDDLKSRKWSVSFE